MSEQTGKYPLESFIDVLREALATSSLNLDVQEIAGCNEFVVNDCLRVVESQNTYKYKVGVSVYPTDPTVGINQRAEFLAYMDYGRRRELDALDHGIYFALEGTPAPDKWHETYTHEVTAKRLKTRLDKLLASFLEFQGDIIAAAQKRKSTISKFIEDRNTVRALLGKDYPPEFDRIEDESVWANLNGKSIMVKLGIGRDYSIEANGLNVEQIKAIIEAIR